MELPTMLVRVKASGHVCRINVSDFNSETHEDPTLAKAETADAASDSSAEDAGKKSKGKK